MYSVDVIIPSYKPDQKLRKLLELVNPQYSTSYKSYLMDITQYSTPRH